MDTHETDPDILIRAFGKTARAALIDGLTVEVPGLGALRVRHEPSRIMSDDGGRRLMLPPADRVVLDPSPTP